MRSHVIPVVYRHIFRLHTARMNLSEDVDLEELVQAKDDMSGADIKATCSTSSVSSTSPAPHQRPD